MQAGLRYVRSVPELFVPLVMMAVVGTLSYNFQTVFPLFVTRDLNGSDATFTVLFSVTSAARWWGRWSAPAAAISGSTGSAWRQSPTASRWR